jgi:hypothetical protein
VRGQGNARARGSARVRGSGRQRGARARGIGWATGNVQTRDGARGLVVHGMRWLTGSGWPAGSDSAWSVADGEREANSGQHAEGSARCAVA